MSSVSNVTYEKNKACRILSMNTCLLCLGKYRVQMNMRITFELTAAVVGPDVGADDGKR